MRLICPNCEAQYDVPDGVVPEEGRDVQCSSCGTTWFQHHPDHQPDDDDENASKPAPGLKTPEPEEQDVPAPAAADVEKPVEQAPAAPNVDVKEPEPAVRPRETVPAEQPDAAAQEHEPEPVDPPRPMAQARKLDSSVEAILRAEAERETNAREIEADRIETQPDLGLTESEPKKPEIEAGEQHVARIRSPETATEAAGSAIAAAQAGSRSNLLPDIEEINSSLRSTNDRKASAVQTAEQAAANAKKPKSRGGFRAGFLLVVLLAILAGLIYVYAPQIADALPQVNPTLTAYVAQVDAARVSLDDFVVRFLTWLDQVAAPRGEAG